MKFTLRDMLWATLVVGLACAWYLDARDKYGFDDGAPLCEECEYYEGGHRIDCPVVQRYYEERLNAVQPLH